MIAQTQMHSLLRSDRWTALEVTISGTPGVTGLEGVLLDRERLDRIMHEEVICYIDGKEKEFVLDGRKLIHVDGTEVPSLEDLVESSEPTTENVCQWAYARLARAIREERKQLKIAYSMDLMLQSVRLCEFGDIWVTVS